MTIGGTLKYHQLTVGYLQCVQVRRFRNGPILQKKLTQGFGMFTNLAPAAFTEKNIANPLFLSVAWNLDHTAPNTLWFFSLPWWMHSALSGNDGDYLVSILDYNHAWQFLRNKKNSDNCKAVSKWMMPRYSQNKGQKCVVFHFNWTINYNTLYQLIYQMLKFINPNHTCTFKISYPFQKVHSLSKCNKILQEYM